jgi:hypothetical protein
MEGGDDEVRSMTQAFISIRTQDGTVLARDPLTGLIASGRTLDEAFAELRRLVGSHTHAYAARHPREGIAA